MSHVHDAHIARQTTRAQVPPQPATEPQEATLGGLVSQLTTQLPELIRSEIRLAQAEVTRKGKRAGVGLGMFSVAGLLAFFGFAVLLATIVLLLDLLLAAWAATLIVAVVLFTLAGAAGLIGKKKVQEVGPPTPGLAVDGLRKDLATVKGERR